MAFSFDSFVTDARAAAAQAESTRAIRDLMTKTLRSPEKLADSNPLKPDQEDILLFEDDTVSVWVCRFEPDTVIPPHEHKMNAFIGVFEGREKNIFFKKEIGQLKYMSTKTVASGELLTIGSNGLHSVVADGSTPCCSLHVYTGPLSTIKRSMFDWDSGESLAFNDENYHRMKRHSSELDFLPKSFATAPD